MLAAMDLVNLKDFQGNPVQVQDDVLNVKDWEPRFSLAQQHYFGDHNGGKILNQPINPTFETMYRRYNFGIKCKGTSIWYCSSRRGVDIAPFRDCCQNCHADWSVLWRMLNRDMSTLIPNRNYPQYRIGGRYYTKKPHVLFAPSLTEQGLGSIRINTYEVFTSAPDKVHRFYLMGVPPVCQWCHRDAPLLAFSTNEQLTLCKACQRTIGRINSGDQQRVTGWIGPTLVAREYENGVIRDHRLTRSFDTSFIVYFARNSRNRTLNSPAATVLDLQTLRARLGVYKNQHGTHVYPQNRVAAITEVHPHVVEMFCFRTGGSGTNPLGYKHPNTNEPKKHVELYNLMNEIRPRSDDTKNNRVVFILRCIEDLCTDPVHIFATLNFLHSNLPLSFDGKISILVQGVSGGMNDFGVNRINPPLYWDDAALWWPNHILNCTGPNPGFTFRDEKWKIIMDACVNKLWDANANRRQRREV